MKEICLSKRQQIPLPRGRPSPRVAGANPRCTRTGKCTSAASSQRALVYQDILKTTRELQKNHQVKQSPRESLKSFNCLPSRARRTHSLVTLLGLCPRCVFTCHSKEVPEPLPSQSTCSIKKLVRTGKGTTVLMD
jgi:hypothetical protein